MKRRNRKGFTIVELVIVIAVIGILAAVLIPTFGTIIADAKETAAIQDIRAAYTELVAEKAKTGETLPTLIKVTHTNGTVIIINNGKTEVFTNETDFKQYYFVDGELTTQAPSS